MPNKKSTQLPAVLKPATLVSVGMPVFNGARRMKPALDFILAQINPNFELIVSDNCSTDETQSICETYAARDKRVRYFRQTENIGAARNFRFVLEQARGKYFFWNAGDDIRSPDFISNNVAFLETHPDFVGSTSRARDEGDTFNTFKMGDRRLDHERAEDRILEYFRGWHRNAIFYSIYRREVLVNNPILYGPEHLGQDWSMILHLAKTGKFQRLDEGELVLGKGGTSDGLKHLRAMRKRRIEYVLPHWEMSKHLREVSRDFSWAARLRLLYRALRMDAHANLGRLMQPSDR